MINRLRASLKYTRLLTEDEVFEDKGEDEMEEKNLAAQDLLDEMKTSTGYMIGITFLKDGVLKHHFLTNNFLIGDIKVSLNEIRKLALQKPSPKIDSKADETQK